MKSVEAIMVTLTPILDIFLSVATTLGDVVQNNLSKSWRFASEMSMVESHYSETIAFGIHSNFPCDSENYDIGKLQLSLDSSFLSI